MGTHYWIQAASRRERDSSRANLDLPPPLAVVDANRNLRGPYTAAGTLLRTIGTEALRLCPQLGPDHHVEILTAAPEFAGTVPSIEMTLEFIGTPDERTRYQARLHTVRIAHGLTDIVQAYLAALGGGPRSLVVESVHEADPTDTEFLAVLLRRIDPRQLTVVLGSDERPLMDPSGPVDVSLVEAVTTYAVHVGGDTAQEPGASRADGRDFDEWDGTALAQAYVDSDGTSDDPQLRAAYERLPDQTRRQLHDERAAALTACGERSLLFGAIPYHAERGSDPAGAGAAALRSAQMHCKSHGLFHAAVELGLRGRALVDRDSRPELWWDFTGDITTSISAAGRAAEAEALYDEIRAMSCDPAIHMHAAYGTAMLYARHYPDEQRDPRRARIWLNEAIAIATLLEDPKERSFYTVFNRNGLALVEVREGNFDEGLRLLNEGIERLDRELAPGERLLHRMGLRYNRAQLFGMSGHLPEALTDYTTVIDTDPYFADHYFNRGNILRRLGRNEEALADYESALRLSPPFPEAFYNCGDTRLELGDVDGALANFTRVLELEPAHAEARLNRAALWCDLDQLDDAWREVTEGLRFHPDNAHLLCLKGRVLVDRGDPAGAREALSAALRINDRIAEAWAIRGGLALEEGDTDAAIRDLSRAIELAGTSDMRFNRAMAYESAGRFADAAADYDAAGDDPDAHVRRDLCLQHEAEKAPA